MSLDRFRLMFQYELWANRRALESLQAAKQTGRGPGWLAHILAAQQAWLTRLNGQDSSRVEIFPELTLEQCAVELERLADLIEAYLEGLVEPALATEIAYRTQSGKELRNTPLDILTHVGMHSHYHRGQIASELRRLGGQPAVTDFIAFRRL